MKKMTPKQGVEILIVEDSPTQAEHLKILLEERGYRFVAVRDGAQALVQVQRRLPDLVVSDVIMPEMDGFELCRRIKADPKMKEVPVILLTSLSDPADVVKGLESGADNFIFKPYDDAYLLKRIEFALANRSLREGDAFSRMGVEVAFNGRKFYITSDRLQILNLLLSTYEAAVQRNQELTAVRDELRSLNENLEFRVRERTRALEAEIVERQRIDQERMVALREAEEARSYFRSVFESSPGLYLVLRTDEPYTIVSVSEAYLRATFTRRETMLGKGMFAVFPDNPEEPDSDGTRNLRASLNRVRTTGQADSMAVQRYPVRKPDGAFEERFWSPVNSPVLGADGRVAFIIHRVEDVTEFVRLQKEQGAWAEGHRSLNTKMQSMEVDLVLRAREVQALNERLRASEERLRSMFASTTAGIALTGLNGRFVEVNPAYCELVGYTEAELMQLDFSGITHPDDRAANREEVGRIVRGELDHAIVEKRYIRKDGRVVWARISVSAIRDGAGKPGQIIGVAQDITAQREAREAVRESEERFRLLAKATNDAIWDWNLQTNELWWNEGITTLFGYPRDEVETTIDSWYKRVHSDDREDVVREVQQAIDRGDESWSGEYRFVCKDGSSAYVLDRGHIIRDTTGKAVRMIGGMTDLTERRKTEEKLREQAELLDKAQDAILVRSLEGKTLYWNKSAERLYGWSSAEALGRTAMELLSPDPALYDEALAHLLKQGMWTGILPKKRRDGAGIEVECHWTLVRDSRGEPKCIFVVDTDITERRKMEQQFFRAQRMESIGTLAGGIAHDLNNLLSPILMGAGLLRRFAPSPQTLPIVQTIEKSALRGTELVKQVLSFARGAEGAQVSIHLGDIVREIQTFTAHSFPKNIIFETAITKDLWLTRGDPTQLNQVLMNLCVNARDAMPEGGSLRLSLHNIVIDEHYAAMNRTARAGRFIQIEVSDTGHGMRPEVAERIFEPFYTTKDQGKGTGLGLSTVLGIVRGHGGFVNVYTEIGRGSVFKIHLPAQAEPDAAPATAADGATVELPRGRGETILVVDDEESIRSITKQTLEAFNYRAITAEDGASAIAAYAQHRDEVALVLTDVMMPVMDGIALANALRRLNSGLPIIAASGHQENMSLDRISVLGIAHVLTKPYSAETLLVAIHQVLHSDDT